MSTQTVQQTPAEAAAQHETLAFSYPDGERYTVDISGTSLAPTMRGTAHVKHEDGRSHIRLRMRGIRHPQSLGASYTTYMLWAVTPDGRASSVGELPVRSTYSFTGTTPSQSFALIITAEPYATVTVPSGAIVAENTSPDANAARSTAGVKIATRADPADASTRREADYATPLPLLGARRAMEAAGQARAELYAPQAWQDAQHRLAALEQSWAAQKPDQAQFVRQFAAPAREVMRAAEGARQASIAAALEARRRADQSTARALDAARRAAIESAVAARDDLVRAQQDVQARANQAQTEAKQEKTRADEARASAQRAQADATRARAEAQQAERERDALQRELLNALAEVLETRRQDRSLVCTFSDVWFDLDAATLTPGGRDKLQKLAAVLLRNHDGYRVQIEGHTDASGSDDYNLRLSQQRAEAVRHDLNEAGVDPERIVVARGLGSACPVASNDTREGRQLNRRVEIIVTDGEAPDTGGTCQP